MIEPFRNKSHLHRGFSYAGHLRSIRAQRQLQASLLSLDPPRKLLVVGAAYGHELEVLLGAIASDVLTLVVVDLEDVADDLCALPSIRAMANRFTFQRTDVLSLERLAGFGEFDAVQCGFVLHDIPYDLKDAALANLSAAMRIGGRLLISEMFHATGECGPVEADLIYRRFIAEATQALKRGKLRKADWKSLVGDSNTPGLLRSRRDAIAGVRDFLEDLPGFSQRIMRQPLQACSVIQNPHHDRLFVMDFRRTPSSAPIQR